MCVRKSITLSLLVLSAAVHASAETPLKATVPFDFAIGSTQMSAGEYTITFDQSGVVRIASEDGKSSAAVITQAVQTARAPSRGKLIFNKYGEHYFLAQVWSSGYQQGRELRKSSRELEMARNGMGLQTAALPAARR
jgi:hypothetical protein